MIAAGVDHVSAYALIVEDGTRLAARMRRGELPMPDDDVAADRYLAAEAALTAAGLSWYEVSNWARARRRAAGTTCSTGAAATGGGSGPGAHSHVGGVRWWNVKHPTAYAARLADGALARPRPRGARRAAERHIEDVHAAAAAGRRAAAGGARPGGRAGGARRRARRRPAGRAPRSTQAGRC